MSEGVSITGIQFWGPNEHTEGGMRIHWASSKGFGTIDIYSNKGHELVLDTEFMSNDFVKAVLAKVADCTGEDLRVRWQDGDGNIFVEDSDGNLVLEERDSEHEQ